MDAIITAGGLLKPDDPLYTLTGIPKKALLPLVNRPMISWILDALRHSGIVGNMVIVGLTPAELSYSDERLYFSESTGNLVDNVYAGLYKLQAVNPGLKKFLLFSSDIPLVTPEIVKGFVAECGSQEADIYYAVVKKETMEARFPGSKRTYVPMKDGYFSGGDAFLLDVEAAAGNVELAKALTGSRKNYLQQAKAIGFGFIISVLLRRMTAEQAGQHVARKTNLNGQVVVTQYAELGMDVDKPHQYEMIRTILERRERQKV